MLVGRLLKTRGLPPLALFRRVDLYFFDDHISFTFSSRFRDLLKVSCQKAQKLNYDVTKAASDVIIEDFTCFSSPTVMTVPRGSRITWSPSSVFFTFELSGTGGGGDNLSRSSSLSSDKCTVGGSKYD